MRWRRVTRHMLHGTENTSHVTRHPSHVTRYRSIYPRNALVRTLHTRLRPPPTPLFQHGFRVLNLDPSLGCISSCPFAPPVVKLPACVLYSIICFVCKHVYCMQACVFYASMCIACLPPASQQQQKEQHAAAAAGASSSSSSSKQHRFLLRITQAPKY